MIARVSDTGEVTIPEPLREKWGIGPGAFVEIHEEHGMVVISKVDVAERLRRVYGTLKLDEPTDKLIAEMRDGL